VLLLAAVIVCFNHTLVLMLFQTGKKTLTQDKDKVLLYLIFFFLYFKNLCF